MSERRAKTRLALPQEFWDLASPAPGPTERSALDDFADAVFGLRREDIGATVTLLDVTPTAPVMTLETLRAMKRLLENAPKPSAVIRAPWRADDDTTPEERAAARERRAIARTGRVLVAWLIGRWRR